MADTNFEDWVEELTEAIQPQCSIDNPEDCEACGS